MPASPSLFETFAASLEERIHSGALAPGERLPSVRQACVARGISPSTVFQAYYLLEARGLVEARPRSGFYVRKPRRAARVLAQPAPVMTGATEVAISELIFAVLGSTRDAEVVPLGSAFVGAELFPLAQLARCGARAMRQLPPAQLTAELTAGNARLLQALRRRYGQHDVAIGPDELVICNGAMEGLSLCLQAVTRPGDVVALESPSFYGALQTLERLHLRAVEVPTDPVLGVDPDALAELLQTQKIAACWFMPNFQNPLGTLMPKARKQALVKVLAGQGVPLIEDDVYAELYHGIRRPLPAKAFDQAGLVLHCSSFSKCLAPGYRVGWAAAGRFAPAVQRLKMMSSLATAVPSQLALAEYLEHGGYEGHLRALRQTLAASMAKARSLVLRHFPPGTTVSQPEGGYFLWLQLPGALDTLQLHQLALGQGISSAPGQLFSADRRFRHALRLNVGHPADPRVGPAIIELGRLAQQLLDA